MSGADAISAVGSGMAIALFSYLGVGDGSRRRGEVRDPDRNVPRATLLGTMATAVVYMLALVAVFGVVPTTRWPTPAPRARPRWTPWSVDTMVGGNFWGDVMALVVIVSGIGVLNGSAEMPRAAAQDGLFPERFQRVGSARR